MKDIKKKVVIVVNKLSEETRIAVIENGILSDFFVNKNNKNILNNIYKGNIKKIVPALGSMFVDIGLNKNAYLDINDVVKFNKENIVKLNQDIIVQVYKESINNKGPKVTMSNISLTGRFVVYMPFNNSVNISRKIRNKTECDRLKNIINEIIKKKNISGGIIIRTEANGIKDSEIKKEIDYLVRIWISIVKKFENVRSSNLIYKDLNMVFRILRNYSLDDIVFIHIDSKKEFDDIFDFVKIMSPKLINKIAFYDLKTSIFEMHGVKNEINELYSNKVYLNSGGHIIIQEVESLCAIDVNSGRFISRLTREETAFITNLEASETIAKQLRLRNIGGIIIIDFIDMKEKSNKEKILNELRKFTANDKAKIKILPMTKFGLIEMTRERKSGSLFFTITNRCHTCQGTGFIFQ
ncbi:MAG: Rne/Rng family ribonuclease [Endomicrobium sp.]|jgi:ribonuclease G|nr:Rne/Rng family ribonuclease [Endomicrobium sp.]